MLEVDCPCVTPEVVLKASGHVDKFTDLMVKDEKIGTCYHVDHFLKDFCKDKVEKDMSLSAEKSSKFRHVFAVLDEFSAEQLGAKIKEYGITAPDTKNPLSDPYPFNLMFQTSIGPSELIPGFMRPETAQGIFVNFKDLYYYNGKKLPFAAAQIGQAFRNELAPREDGPYHMIKTIRDNAYQLELPPDFGVHASFNVADLTPYVEPEFDDGEAGTLHSQVGEGDVTLPPMTAQDEEESMSLRSEGPVTRSRSKAITASVASLVARSVASQGSPDDNPRLVVLATIESETTRSSELTPPAPTREAIEP